MTRQALEENLEELRLDAMEIIHFGLTFADFVWRIDAITASRIRKQSLWRVIITRTDGTCYLLESPLRATVIEMIYDELQDIRQDLKAKVQNERC